MLVATWLPWGRATCCSPQHQITYCMLQMHHSIGLTCIYFLLPWQIWTPTIDIGYPPSCLSTLSGLPSWLTAVPVKGQRSTHQTLVLRLQQIRPTRSMCWITTQAQQLPRRGA